MAYHVTINEKPDGACHDMKGLPRRVQDQLLDVIAVELRPTPENPDPHEDDGLANSRGWLKRRGILRTQRQSFSTLPHEQEDHPLEEAYNHYIIYRPYFPREVAANGPGFWVGWVRLGGAIADGFAARGFTC